MKNKRIQSINSMFFYFERFTDIMLDKLIENLAEKNVSYRRIDNKELKELISKYLKREDFVSVANIAFMLAENNQKC